MSTYIIASAPPEPATHFLRIDGYGAQATIVCTAALGADCRMVCPDCADPCDHPKQDMGECNAAAWMNEDDTWECGSGLARVPIDVSWDGDGYRWAFTNGGTA